MLRTLLILIILVIATLLLPFYLQIPIYIISLFLMRYRSLILIPAIVADSWYAPSIGFSVFYNKTFLFALSILFVHFIIIRFTRISQYYDLEKK
jgi:hypothetical protein